MLSFGPSSAITFLKFMVAVSLPLLYLLLHIINSQITALYNVVFTTARNECCTSSARASEELNIFRTSKVCL